MKKPSDIGWSFWYLGIAASQLPVLVITGGRVMNGLVAIFMILLSIYTTHRYSNIEERNTR